MSLSSLKRPPRLYRYASTEILERALSMGEFQLRSPVESLQMLATAHSGNPQPFLVLSFSTQDEDKLFDRFQATSCLVIKRPEEFGERLHRAVKRALPDWAGIDSAIHYGIDSPLGTAFTRPVECSPEHEWRFAWRPRQAKPATRPVTVQVGDLSDIAELKRRPVV